MKKAVTVVVVALGLGAFFLVVPAQVGKSMNRVSGPPPRVSEKARVLHRRLLVADLHADSLLWSRDLLEHGSWGHVDVPRLVEGNVALQAFTIVTKTPRGMNIESNDDRTDNILWLALSERWPAATWRSLADRALYQASRLRDVEARSAGRFTLVRARDDLTRFLARRRDDPSLTAGLLGVEGAHALEGRLANLDLLYDAGVRMMAPSHFFDTEIGGSAAGVKKGGLTPLGKEWLKAMEAKRMIVDLAHASLPTIGDVLALATRPVVVSHTGVRGTCDNARNLSDEHLRGVARTGGLIGIGFWPTAVCGADARAIARAIRYSTNLVGVEHVALGSDFDGAVTTPFDVTGLPAITEALLTEGYSEDDVARIMGGNVIRFLGESLP